MQKPAAPPSTNAHWQQTDRLATIGTLTAGIAHELNNPIGYILSNLTSFQLYLPIIIQYFDILQALVRCNVPEQKRYCCNSWSIWNSRKICSFYSMIRRACSMIRCKVH